MTSGLSTPWFNSFRVCGVLLLGGLFLASHVQAATPPATWTTGHKRVLVIPVRFTDQAGPSDAPNASGYYSGWGNITNGTTAAAINAFFQRSSYGKLSMEFTVLPEINLGVSYTNYNATYGTSGISKFAAWDEPGSFADDVRAKARQVGQSLGQLALYDSDNYDLDFLFCGFIPGQGTLASGRAHGKGIFGTTSLALAHEFGHNFGLQHANGISRSTYYSPIKGGTFFTDTYGDVYDLMGWKNTTPIPLVPDRDLNPYWKWQMGWLTDANIAAPAVSGTYRIHAFDQPALDAGKNYALRIVRDPSRVYWFSYRAGITNPESIWSNNGLEVRIGGESVPATGGHTTLLDMTPGSRGLANIPSVTNNPYATLYDAPLAIGRTYSDNEANIHVTPVKKGGTTPESLDVVLNYGPFPGNVAPTVSISPATLTLAAGVAQAFTATASDPNSDALSYYWEFDDPDALGGTAGGNTHPDARLSTQGSHTWTRSGTFLVRCTVSDMKGGKTIASASVTITGGTTALRTISGVVKDENGNPLAGAVVNNYKGGSPNLVRYGATNFVGASETAADGKYVVHVPAGITGTFYLNVLHQGFSFICSTAGGAVGVYSANVANVDFTRVRTNRTISGGVYVAGRGYNPATDGTVTVNVNGQNIAATGGGWTTNVADGTPLNITATTGTPGNSVFGTFPNPYVAVDDFNLLHLFLNVPGLMPQVGFTSASASSDDTVGTVNIPVTLTPPPGSNSWPANQFIYYWLDRSSTAEYGVDFKMAGGSISFTGGQAPTPYMIPLKILPTGEPKNKTVVIKLGPASSIVNMGPVTTFTYTITNPPAPINAGVIQFAQASYSVAEAAGTVTLVATRTGGSSGSASGYYRTANGTATAGQDYTPTTNFVTWLDGDTANKNVVLTILNDALVEPAETFTVSFFTNTVGASLGALTTATVTITDDDTPPPSPGVIQFAQTAYSVGEAAGTVTLVATRTSGSSSSVNGYYRTANGTATAGQDYTATTNFVTWADGDTANKNVAITILNDSVVESNETFTVTFFTTFGGATIGAQAAATVTITDDDTPPPSPGVIQFAQAAYTVGEAAGTVTLVATRTGGSSSSVNGYYRTANGTATAGQDYTATTNFMTWADGDTASKNVVITVLNDTIVEPAETFTVTFFTTFGGATIGAQATATVTINDDEVVVPENHPPVLPANTVVTLVRPASLVFTNTATDIDVPAQTLTYQLLASPSSATIDANGIVRWTPPAASTNFFQAKVTDSGTPTRSATNSFYVIVNEPLGPENHPPVLPAPTVVTIMRTNVLVFTNTATDIDVPAQTLTYQLLSGPSGASVDANGIVRWTPSSAGANFFQTKVTDNGLPAKSATNSFYVVVNEPVAPENHPPVLPPSGVVSMLKLTPLVYVNTAIDADQPPQALTYQLLVSPSGATIDVNGIVHWTPATVGTNYFQAKVTDNGSPAKSATNSFYVIVSEPVSSENHPPVLPRPTVVTALKLTETVITNTATDIDLPAQLLTYELLAKPDGATIDSNGIVRWTPSATQGSSTNRFRAKVTDNGTPPRSATNVFYVIVNEGNTAPVLFGRSLLTLTNPVSLSEIYTATDSDTPVNTLDFNLVSGPAWMSFTKVGERSAALTGTPPVVTAETPMVAVLQVTDNGTPPLSNQLRVYLLLRPAPPTTSTESFVTRDLPSGYVPGTRLTVTLQANPPSGSAYTVNDTPPGGWALGAISHGGQLDPATGQVKFGPFADAAARTLTYELTPPISETGPKNFVGIASKDNVISGINGEGSLNQAQVHPADLNADLQLNTPELAAYASAWQNGNAWPAGPNPIEVSFVTRAGFLVQRGGTYSVNAPAKLPLAWVSAGLAAQSRWATAEVTTTPTGKGSWRFLPPKLAVGTPATVTIILNPGATDACHAVEEIPPAGWAVANVSHAGVYDAATGRVRWGLFTDQTSRTLTYDVTPTGALAPFAGVASFDGTNASIAGAFEPQIVPAIAEPEFAPVTRLPSGEMVLPLSTRYGTITVIEISDDLRLWTPVWTNSPGNQLFRDLPINTPPGRYYRSVEQ